MKSYISYITNLAVDVLHDDRSSLSVKKRNIHISRLYNVTVSASLLFLCCCLISPAARAERNSSDYAIPADISDSGGRVASADYSNDSAIGGIGGIGSGANATVKQGYAGQLYETIDVNLSASPDTISETGTRQVAAEAVLDDDTRLVLQNGDTAWTIGGWPLASVDGAGLVTASTVYEAMSGSVFTVYGSVTGSLSLLVLNTDNDNFGSYAMDGLDDGWQVQYFGMDNSNAAPWLDPDGDGQSNQYEMIVGTDPTNNASLFAMRLALVSGVSTQMDIAFDPAFPNRNYAVERRADLMSGSWTNLTNYTESSNGTERTVRDLSAINQRTFYRVKVNYNP